MGRLYIFNGKILHRNTRASNLFIERPLFFSPNENDTSFNLPSTKYVLTSRSAFSKNVPFLVLPQMTFTFLIAHLSMWIARFLFSTRNIYQSTRDFHSQNNSTNELLAPLKREPHPLATVHAPQLSPYFSSSFNLKREGSK